MKNFNIQVIGKKPKKIYGLLSHVGEITIGNFKETFIIPLDNWTIEEYQHQWKEGLKRIEINDSSCLVVAVQNLTNSPSIELWTLFKNKNSIFFHNQLLIDETVEHLPINLTDFNAKTCYKFIAPRIVNERHEAINEDGQKIAEWHINIHDFFSSLTENE